MDSPTEENKSGEAVSSLYYTEKITVREPREFGLATH